LDTFPRIIHRMILSMFTVAKAILEVLAVLQELKVIVIIALGTAAVQLAHKSVLTVLLHTRHKIFQISAR